MDEINLLLSGLIIGDDDGRGSFFGLSLGPTDVFGEEAPFDEGLNLLLQLNTVVCVVAMVAVEAAVLRLVSIARRLHRERFPEVGFILDFHQYLGRREEQRSIARPAIAILQLWASGPSNLGSRRITTPVVVPSFLAARFYFRLTPRRSTFISADVLLGLEEHLGIGTGQILI